MKTTLMSNVLTPVNSLSKAENGMCMVLHPQAHGQQT